jgi:hypothetical protein
MHDDFSEVCSMARYGIIPYVPGRGKFESCLRVGRQLRSRFNVVQTLPKEKTGGITRRDPKMELFAGVASKLRS